jgi:glycosyltransferase involved in cell wall biosynthesis
VQVAIRVATRIAPAARPNERSGHERRRRQDNGYRAEVRVVVNAVPVRGTSLGVVTENLLKGWEQLGIDDELHLVLRPGVELDVPGSMEVLRYGGSRVAAMDWHVPALCRRVRADVMLGVTPATTMAPLPCPRGVIALDIRHELRPEQFSARTRLQRGVSYRIGYHQADAIMCISERTRDDLLEAHAYLRARRVVAAQLGADHVLSWAPRVDGPPYALAFGQWGNKNVGLVIDAWALLRQEGADVLPLVIVGLPADAREATVAHVHVHDLDDVVTVQPWLSTKEFQRTFTSASLVVFPSDFEGFGLPALEAMRLGIPVVVTPDKALLEVTGDRATVMDGWDAAALARAVPVAQATSEEDIKAGIEHASAFTWKRTATIVRSTLESTIG